MPSYFQYGGALGFVGFHRDPTRGAQTATRAVYVNEFGSTVVVEGSDFSYGPDGVPTAGAISRITTFKSDGVTRQSSVVDAGITLPQLDEAWLGATSVEPGFAVLALLTATSGQRRGWVDGSELAGTSGADEFVVDSAMPVVIAPGAGFDTVRTTAVSQFAYSESTAQTEADPYAGAPVEISYAEYTGSQGVEFGSDLGGTRTVLAPYGGWDFITGPAAGARLTGNADHFYGGAGGEFVAGLAGDGHIYGSTGYDTARYDLDARYGGTAGVYVDLASGRARDGFGDTDVLLLVEHATGTNLAVADGVGDILLGNGVFNIFAGLGGADYIDGRDGDDMADYSRDAANGGEDAAHVDLGAGFAKDGFGDFDALVSIEYLRGTNGSLMPGFDFGDVLVGDAGHNMFQGLAGVDCLDGGGGRDVVSYEADAAYGGGSAVIVDLAAGEALDGFGSGDKLVGIEDVIGSNGEQADVPGLGDILLGSDGANLLRGLYGNDVLDGRGGDDELSGGPGFDLLTGGAGADLFHFDAIAGEFDRITDFVPGLDHIGITEAMMFGEGLAFVAGGGLVVVTRLATGGVLHVHGASTAEQVIAGFVAVG